MHPKFLALWGGTWCFRIPTQTQVTGPVEDPFRAKYTEALAYMQSHPEYWDSLQLILEMGVADGKVLKRVMRNGSISYTFAQVAANQHAKRG